MQGQQQNDSACGQNVTAVYPTSAITIRHILDTENAAGGIRNVPLRRAYNTQIRNLRNAAIVGGGGGGQSSTIDVYFVRHAKTCANEIKDRSTWRTLHDLFNFQRQYEPDTAILKMGYDHAKEMGSRFARTNDKVIQNLIQNPSKEERTRTIPVLVSSLSRTAETAFAFWEGVQEEYRKKAGSEAVPDIRCVRVPCLSEKRKCCFLPDYDNHPGTNQKAELENRLNQLSSPSGDVEKIKKFAESFVLPNVTIPEAMKTLPRKGPDVHAFVNNLIPLSESNALGGSTGSPRPPMLAFCHAGTTKQLTSLELVQSEQSDKNAKNIKPRNAETFHFTFKYNGNGIETIKAVKMDSYEPYKKWFKTKYEDNNEKPTYNTCQSDLPVKDVSTK
jgi:hypothetical protein